MVLEKIEFSPDDRIMDLKDGYKAAWRLSATEDQIKIEEVTSRITNDPKIPMCEGDVLLFSDPRSEGFIITVKNGEFEVEKTPNCGMPNPALAFRVIPRIELDD